MKLLNIKSGLVVGMLLFVAQPGMAADQKARTFEDCQKFYDACYAQCRKKYPGQDLEGDAARTTCGTTCAAQRTACKAAIEYTTKARPALEEMIDQLKSFLDDLLKTLPGGKPDQNSPEKPSDQGPVKI